MIRLFEFLANRFVLKFLPTPKLCSNYIVIFNGWKEKEMILCSMGRKKKEKKVLKEMNKERKKL